MTNDLWDQATRPARSALSALLDVVPSLVHPAPDSEAMSELAQESSLARPSTAWGERPVQDPHALAAMTLAAAADFASAFVVVTGSAIKVAFAPAHLARAAIEAATRSCWLFESGIGARARVSRAVNERLADLHWQKQLPPETGDAAAHARSRIAELEREAKALGYELGASNRRQPKLIKPGRKSPSALISRLIGPNDGGLGKTLHSFLSAVGHSAGSGMVPFMNTVEPQDVRPYPIAQVSLSSDLVWTLTQATGWAIGKAGDAYLHMHAAQAEGWHEAHKAFIALMKRRASTMKGPPTS